MVNSSSSPERSSGVLAHVSSLPGPFGIGDIGPEAEGWIDTLADARQTWWQVLPLGPTGYGDSPYQCYGAMAGNPDLLSPDRLVEDGLLDPQSVAGADFPADRVEYERVHPYKARLTRVAWGNFQRGAARELAAPFEEFCGREREWLADFALFMALKDRFHGVSWQEWPAEFMARDPAALATAGAELRDEVGWQQFRQFLFHEQWERLKRHAVHRGVRLIGDLPIFVATDSSDVWSHPELFQLDAERRPKAVAGVPPDYFSATGQLWGNPLYDWERHRQGGYAWWIARLRAALRLVDLVRLDHFRGFEAYWAVPAGSLTAEPGRWVPGPAADLIDALRQALGGLPLIAEDLGVITPVVEALRLRFGLPGMRILQFAFGGAREDRFLPYTFDRNTVVYTGTHDNDTTQGWFRALDESEHRFFRRYVPATQADAAWDLIRLALASVADRAIVPLQDVLSLGSEARMNLPGTATGNWRWRFQEEDEAQQRFARLAELTEIYGRAPAPAAAGEAASSSSSADGTSPAVEGAGGRNTER